MPPAKRAKRGAAAPEPFELRYFPVMAKGLGPALAAEFSGLPWKGSTDLNFVTGTGANPSEAWAKLKADSPFGQLPILTTAEGVMIAQTTAIINYIGKAGGTEGEGHDFALSQMLIAESEDIYALLQKVVPTVVVKSKGSQADYDAFWATTLPSHLQKLEKLCAGKPKFTATGTSPGELYLFSALHQCVLVKPGIDAKGAQTRGPYQKACSAAAQLLALTNC